MLTFAFWAAAIITALAMLASLVWLLWLRVRNTLRAGAHASEQISAALAQAPSAEELIQRGVLSEPRDTDVYGGPERAAQLRGERQDRAADRAQRKQESREKTYRRWAAYYGD